MLVKLEVMEKGWTAGQACASTSCAARQVLSDYELLLICLPTEESYVPGWGMLPSFISPDCCAVAGGGLDPQRQCMTIKPVPHNQGVVLAATHVVTPTTTGGVQLLVLLAVLQPLHSSRVRCMAVNFWLLG